MKPLFALTLVSLLIACADPVQTCRKAASRDLTIVRALIAETENNIERGYAIRTETRSVVYTDFCLGTAARSGQYSFCNRTAPVTTKTPVALDLEEEKRILASLRKKKTELEHQAAIDLQRCEIAATSG